MTEEAIRRKLQADGEVNGDDRRINVFYKNFLAMAKRVDNPDTRDAAVGSWASDRAKVDAILEQIEHGTRKSVAVHQMNLAEVAHYKSLHQRISSELATASSRISECQAELAEAKVIRAHREEYELMATAIDALPARPDTAARIAAAEGERDEAQRRRDALTAKLAQRKAQFHALMLCLRELEDILKTDTDMDTGGGGDDEPATEAPES